MKLSNPHAARCELGPSNQLILATHFGLRIARGIRVGIDHMDWLRHQDDYCLDAPSMLPGGSCYSEDEYIPKGFWHRQTFQTVLLREQGTGYRDYRSEPSRGRV